MAHSENLTIMFVDMVGFTERTSRQSRAQNKAMLRQFHGLLGPLIRRLGGRRVKSIGDALLVTFRSPTDGVHCGMALQDALAEFNAGCPEPEQFRVRVAVNVGEVRTEGRDVFGEAVNVAARVESLTPPEEIYFTEAVYLSMNKAEVPSQLVGEHKLKGIPEPVRLYRVPPRQVSRLVSGGEDLGAAPGELPFGGMHRFPTYGGRLREAIADVRRHLPEPQAWYKRQRPPLRIALLALPLALPLLLFTAHWRLAEPQIEEPPPTLAVAPNPQLAEQRKVARFFAAQGHEAFTQGRRRDAAAAYIHALKLDQGLSQDVELAARLVACLSWGGDTVAGAIKQHASPAILDELARRTAQEGGLGRRRAAQLLKDLAQDKRIDQAGLAIADLREAETCATRLDAVQRLRRLQDPRALPALRDTLSGGLGSWLSNTCLRSEAKAAVEELEKKSRR